MNRGATLVLASIRLARGPIPSQPGAGSHRFATVCTCIHQSLEHKFCGPFSAAAVMMMVMACCPADESEWASASNWFHFGPKQGEGCVLVDLGGRVMHVLLRHPHLLQSVCDDRIRCSRGLRVWHPSSQYRVWCCRPAAEPRSE